jgi:hypothetical protein
MTKVPIQQANENLADQHHASWKPDRDVAEPCAVADIPL